MGFSHEPFVSSSSDAYSANDDDDNAENSAWKVPLLDEDFCNNNIDESLLIDNTQNLYIPIRLPCGVQILCQPDIFDCNSTNNNHTTPIVDIINDDIQDCINILPKSVHALIKRTRIWINRTYYCGLREQPQILNHMTTHHHEAWLLWARDRPEKTLGIEIYNCNEYLRMRNHWNGCGLILHELCHLIHQIVLGLNNENIQKLYKIAQKSKKYNCVLRRDWAGKDIDTDLAYCMIDYKEFFAELSVTYWSKGYTELDKASTQYMYECCPIITETNVLQRINNNISLYRSKQQRYNKGKIHNFLRGNGICHNILSNNNLPHCNKFYPFTCGQLRYYDYQLYKEFDIIWQDIITNWDDPDDNTTVCCCWSFLYKNNKQTTTTKNNKFLDTNDNDIVYVSSSDANISVSDTIDL